MKNWLIGFITLAATGCHDTNAEHISFLSTNSPPRGEYAFIDVKDSNKVLEVLLSTHLRPDYQARIAKDVAMCPENHHPGALLATGIYCLKRNDYQNGAFFVQAALVRAHVDVCLSQDPSIQDTCDVMLAQVKEALSNFDEERFATVTKQVARSVIKWDRQAPRGYDRRWASLRSSGLADQKPLNYLPISEQQPFIEKAYQIFLQASG